MTNLVFDFDGTLHNTIKIYAPAFRKAYLYLSEKGLAEHRDWTDKEIGRWLGYSSRDMWNAFMPQLSEIEKETCSMMIGNEMLWAIKSGEAQLYDGIIEVLRELNAAGFGLIFLSNCKTGYMKECVEYFMLERYFSAFYCTEQYAFAPKDEIFKKIAHNHPGQFIVIGDRELDLQIAKTHRLPFIGCSYGYGGPAELQEADYIANNPFDLLPAIRTLEANQRLKIRNR